MSESRPASRTPAQRRRRAGIAAFAALAVGWVLIMQSLGWAQTSYYAFVRALASGTAQIDANHWETRDKSYTNGHFFSVKAPGMPVLLTPAYLVLDALGAQTLAREAADNARRHGARQWTYRGLYVHKYGGNPQRAAIIKRRLELDAPMVWALGLLGTVLPALLLLALVRRRVERIEPGLGALAAVTLGMATLIMPFAVNFLGHVLAALLSFGAFAVAWHERDGPARPALLALAGLLAGLAVFTEYPLAITGIVVGVYVLSRPGPDRTGLRTLLARGGAYAAGVVAGVIPLLAYNLWAFGSMTTLSYTNAVDEQGTTGHATLGLNGGGFFGIDVPRPRQAMDLLVSPRGLFIVTPIVIMGLVGAVLMARRGRRAEALVVGAVAAAYYLYDTGYWLPMGGGTPGPRFLIPMLPFLALGIGCAWRARPALTLALAVPSAITMIAATVTYPLVGAGGTHQWAQRIGLDNFQHTLLSVLGADNGWWAIAPVLIAFLAAGILAVRSAPALDWRRDTRAAWLALGAWGVAAGVLAPWIGEEQIGGPKHAPTGFIDHRGTGAVVTAAVIAGALALLAARWRSAQAVDDDAAADGAREAQAGDRPRAPRRPRGAGEAVGVQHHGAHADRAQAAD